MTSRMDKASRDAAEEKAICEVARLAFREADSLGALTSTGELVDSFNNLQRPFLRNLPNDPRGNSIHWARDVVSVLREIAHSIVWMKAHAEFYKQQVPQGDRPSHASFTVGYYAGNAITRIDACRDKIALMIWSYYEYFNPEKLVSDYGRILKDLG